MLLLHCYFVLDTLEFLKRLVRGGGGGGWGEEETLTLYGYHDLTGDLLVSIVAMDRKEKEHTVTSKNSSCRLFDS